MSVSNVAAVLQLTFLVMTVFCSAHANANLLFQAVRADDADAVKRAVENGANINERGPGGQTALMMSCLTGKADAAAALFELGADASIGEKDGYTCLHGVAFQGRPKVAKIALEHGLDVNAFHPDGYTPLHRACWGRSKGHFEVFKVFAEGGADIFAASRNGKHAMCAEMTSHPDILNYYEFLEDAHEEL